MRSIKSSGFALVLASATLNMYGLLILYSTTRPLINGNGFFFKQCVWLSVSLIISLFFLSLNLKKLERFGPLIGIIAIILLVSVLIPGISRSIKGSRRWIEFLGLRIQPSEPAKICFVFFFAYFLTNKVSDIKNFIKGFLFPMAIVCTFCVLLLLEPDFGTAALFGSVAIILLFVHGIRLSFLLPAIIIAFCVFCTAIYLNPVRMNRILAFINLEENRKSVGYQLWQSLIAFSSGGWFGHGIGEGKQQFFYLPEAHTDFIGAILVEELGIIHFMIMLLCFCSITFFGLKIVKQQQQAFLFYIGLGIVSFLTIQVFLNIGVITGILPTKGLALPFISYGGSSLITNFCMISILINLTRDIYSPFAEIQKK